MFSYQTSVRLHHTDAAGRLFFASQLQLAHDAYEAFLENQGLSLAKIIREEEYDLPIVHADADYKAPLVIGDHLTIEISVSKVGESSFILNYLFRRGEQTIGLSKTVHTAVDSKTGHKRSLPEEIKTALQAPTET